MTNIEGKIIDDITYVMPHPTLQQLKSIKCVAHMGFHTVAVYLL